MTRKWQTTFKARHPLPDFFLLRVKKQRSAASARAAVARHRGRNVVAEAGEACSSHTFGPGSLSAISKFPQAVTFVFHADYFLLFDTSKDKSYRSTALEIGNDFTPAPRHD
jgi:hypothetical protein